MNEDHISLKLPWENKEEKEESEEKEFTMYGLISSFAQFHHRPIETCLGGLW